MLRDYRKNKTDFTQDDMGKFLNITTRTYQRIEKENDCKLSQAKSISEIFGDTIDNIFYKEVK